MKNYKMITNWDLEEFEKTVNESIKIGWKVQGSVSISSYNYKKIAGIRSIEDGTYFKYTQAMVKS